MEETSRKFAKLQVEAREFGNHFRDITRRRWDALPAECARPRAQTPPNYSWFFSQRTKPRQIYLHAKTALGTLSATL